MTRKSCGSCAYYLPIPNPSGDSDVGQCWINKSPHGDAALPKGVCGEWKDKTLAICPLCNNEVSPDKYWFAINPPRIVHQECAAREALACFSDLVIKGLL